MCNTEVKEILFFSSAPPQEQLVKLGFVADDRGYENKDIGLFISHAAVTSADITFTNMRDMAIDRLAAKEAKEIEVAGAETVSHNIPRETAFACLSGFEKWCAGNHLDFSPKNIDTFIKSMD